MPAPGEQHQQTGKTVANPFEDAKHRISEYTAQDIATLQSRLEKQLGPEYISSRSGPSGQKVHYVAAEKCIQLANEIFGFNGWSSQIMNIQVDFVDEIAHTLKISLGLSVIVRVTLRDGTFHEDIGYGHIENCKGKAAAFEKAKKEGTTDGLKRALRSFGNVLGNCIYDKEYLGKVTKIKVQQSRWDESNLYRHSTVVPRKASTAVSTEEKLPKVEENDEELLLDDEFGDFDDADFGENGSEIHPDEVILPSTRSANSHQFQNNRRSPGPASHAAGSFPARTMPNVRAQSMQAPPRPQNVAQDGTIVQRAPPQPHTPNNGNPKSSNGLGPATRVPVPLDSGLQSRTTSAAQTVVNGRVLNQPSRAAAVAQNSLPGPTLQSHPGEDTDILAAGFPPQGTGFFSARAAALVIPSDNVIDPNDAAHPPLLTNLPAFDPNAESPSIRKTPGVDCKRSAPIPRDQLKAPSGSSQAPVAQGNGLGGPRSNIINPQLDVTRRIGVPGAGGTSPMANRGAYKPPSMKRPLDIGDGSRTPLVDLPANGAIGPLDSGGGDVKRQRAA